MQRAIDRSHLVIRKSPLAKLRLICFSYAGGSAGNYLPYQKLLHSAAEIVAVQLPGRGARMRETPVSDWEGMRALIAREVLPLVDRPCVLFGHSFGTRMVYEVTRQLVAEGRTPHHVILSGANAPHVIRARPPIHNLPDSTFIDEIKRMGGTPDDVLNNAEMMRLLLPMLRADFTLTERHAPGEITAFPCQATVLFGDRDDRTLNGGLGEWQDYFSSRVAFCQIRGAHFYVDTNREAVANAINTIIETVCATV